MIRLRKCGMCGRPIFSHRWFGMFGGHWPWWMTKHMDCGGDCLGCMEALDDWMGAGDE